MAPNGRLTISDHPALLFGRKNYYRDAPPTGSQSALNSAAMDELPQIPRLDTRSFSNLFEVSQDSRHEHRHPSQVQNTDMATASPFTGLDFLSYSNQVSPVEALHSHSNVTAMTSKSIVARGDSTASTASSLPSDSDRFSAVSSNSSRSSLVDDSQLRHSPGRWSARSKLDRTPQLEVLTSRSVCWPDSESLPSTNSTPTDIFEKPLPLRPFDVSSVLEEMRRPIRDDAPKSKLYSLRPFFWHSNTIDASNHLTIREMKEQRKGPAKSRRGMKLGKAMTQSLTRRFSKPLLVTANDSTKPAEMSSDAGLDANSQELDVTEDRETASEDDIVIPPDAAEQIVLNIMTHSENLKDLQTAATLSRGFYGTFKKHEEALVGHVLRRSSPAALELLQRMPHAQISMRGFREFDRTLNSLRSMILERCRASLKPEILLGLEEPCSQQGVQLDQALWRVWTFCVLFGKSSAGVMDLEMQFSWLNGAPTTTHGSSVGLADGSGLSVRELQEMSGIWRCMQMLLNGFANRVDEARSAGVFNNCTIDQSRTEEWYLQEWINHLLTLGPPVVESLASCDFGHAAVLGYTVWTPPQSAEESLSRFLISAIAATYQQRIVAEATMRANKASLPRRASKRVRYSDSFRPALYASRRSTERHCSLPIDPRSGHQLRRVTKNIAHGSTSTPAVNTIRRKPLTVRTTVDEHCGRYPMSPDTVGQDSRKQPEPIVDQSDAGEENPQPPPFVRSTSIPLSPTLSPVNFQSLSLMTGASTRLSATLFPVVHPPSPVVQHETTASPTTSELDSPSRCGSPNTPPIEDPVDKAMTLLVCDMGFDEADAKRALARCDTGFGMDVEAAIELLMRDHAPIEVPKPLRPSRQKNVTAINNDTNDQSFCDGCHNTATSPKIVSAAQHERQLSDLSTSSSIGTTAQNYHYQLNNTEMPLSTLETTSMPSLAHSLSQAKAYKLLGVEQNAGNPHKMSQVLGFGKFGTAKKKPNSIGSAGGRRNSVILAGKGIEGMKNFGRKSTVVGMGKPWSGIGMTA